MCMEDAQGPQEAIMGYIAFFLTAQCTKACSKIPLALISGGVDYIKL